MPGVSGLRGADADGRLQSRPARPGPLLRLDPDPLRPAGQEGLGLHNVPFPDPFYQPNQMRDSAHPFPTQNAQKVALERITELGSQGRVAWLPPNPENASLFKDQNQLKD